MGNYKIVNKNISLYTDEEIYYIYIYAYICVYLLYVSYNTNTRNVMVKSDHSQFVGVS